MTLWWLSFVDYAAEEFIGACVVDIPVAGPAGAVTAQLKSLALGCNPGRGSLLAQELPRRLEGKVGPQWIGVLMNRELCNVFGVEFGLERDVGPS